MSSFSNKFVQIVKPLFSGKFGRCDTRAQYLN